MINFHSVSSFIIKDLMTELAIPTFTRHYKYKSKIEESAFIIKYLISGDQKSHEETDLKAERPAINPIDSKSSEQQLEEKPAKVIKQDERANRKEDRRIEIEREQMEELRKYTKVNMKDYKIVESFKGEISEEPRPKEKKKKYKKVERTQDEPSQEPEEKNEKVEKVEKREKYSNKHKSVMKSNEKAPIFDEYVPIQEIEKSRQEGKKIYFKGRLQFGEGPKYRARVVSDEYQGLLLVEGKQCNRAIHDDKVFFSIINEENEKIYCKINHIIPSKRQIVGKVELLHGKKIHILNPINGRIAAMNIHPDSIPKKLKQKLSTHYFIAEYIGWNIKSEYPECKIIEEFGKFGDIDIETGSLLKTHGVEDTEYNSETVRAELKKFFDRIDPNSGEYLIPEEEISKREDLREKRIITIDPVNARDFDDALSVRPLGKDLFEVGVHIADASFFVEEGSEIDNQAKKRTTSVYLVHRVLPMLPRILCENLCSLNPGCERLTFTLWIVLDIKGQIVEKPRFSRSVIKSKARFTYEQAQLIIEGKINSQEELEEGFGCTDKADFQAIASDIKLLHQISTELRKRRVERGSLFFQIPKKVFKLNQSSHPISFQIYERKEAHFLVEELMILANEQIGEILVKQLQGKALLRRHKYPGPKKIQRFQNFMKKINMPIEMSQSARVQDQVNEVLSKNDIKQSIKDIVKYEMINLLEAADYFITGQTEPISWIHYALNSPVYTHFTSPIRRYPDIIVHRLLAAILEKKSTLATVAAELVQLCNEKKLQSKRVSNGCEKIFMCLYLRDSTVITKGIIMDAEEWGIKVCVPRYDFKGILRFKEIPKLHILDATVDPLGRSVVKAEYKGEVTTKFILKEMQEIEIKLSCKEGFPLDYQLTLLMPHPRIPGQHLLIA